MFDNYEDKLERERRWHVDAGFRTGHFLNSSLFWSPKRNSFNYVLPRQRLAAFVRQVLRRDGLTDPRILIAPIGKGHDLEYLRGISDDVHGIDISQEALDSIDRPDVEKVCGDIRNMVAFGDDSFDVIVVPLFFHHYVKFGFDGPLREIHRVLKPDGHFFALEPSSLHPLCWVTRTARKIFGNISGTLPDEAPFRPSRLSRAMRRCGYRRVQMQGASFTHCRIPIWMAKINNVLTLPLLRAPVLKHFAWMCLYYGQK